MAPANGSTLSDEVRARLRGGQWRRDGEIVRAVASTLAQKAVVPEGQVWVCVRNGWVTLKGHVDWEYQRAAASATARTLIGVRGVINSIRVAAGG